jgi:transglutaminase/protease-like cytokinesis protein 3
MVTISDPVAGKRYTFESNSNTYRTARIPVSTGNSASNTQVRRTPPGSSSSSSSSNTAVRAGRGGAAITKAELGSQMKNGALATGSRETEVIAAGKIGNSQPITVTRETWYSTELKRNVEVKVSDPQHGNSTTELTNLVQAEPSAALFTVPAGYTESNGRGPRRGAFARGGRPKPAQ